MRTVLFIVLCGVLGIVAAILATIGSNLFVQGYAFRSGYEAVAEPVEGGVIGLAWGLLAGSIGAIWARMRTSGHALLAGLGLTLAGIVVAAGGITAQRYVALPRTPMIDGRELWLAFELRLPPGGAASAEQPTRGEFRTSGQGNDISGVVLVADRQELRDGRIVLPGSAQLLRAVRDRRLEIFDGKVPWPIFQISLPAYPTHADMAWTNWYPAENAGTEARQRARGYQIRYRVIQQSD